jgi:small subunit ribosomal protein S17
MRRRTICYAHDEANVSKIGDTVEIEESAPLSKLKRWVLKRWQPGQAGGWRLRISR